MFYAIFDHILASLFLLFFCMKNLTTVSEIAINSNQILIQFIQGNTNYPKSIEFFQFCFDDYPVMKLLESNIFFIFHNL